MAPARPGSLIEQNEVTVRKVQKKWILKSRPEANLTQISLNRCGWRAQVELWRLQRLTRLILDVFPGEGLVFVALMIRKSKKAMIYGASDIGLRIARWIVNLFCHR